MNDKSSTPGNKRKKKIEWEEESEELECSKTFSNIKGTNILYYIESDENESISVNSSKINDIRKTPENTSVVVKSSRKSSDPTQETKDFPMKHTNPPSQFGPNFSQQNYL